MASKHTPVLDVGFVEIEESEQDLILSFAIYDSGSYDDSLILLRSKHFEKLLDRSERGVKLSYDEVVGDVDGSALLRHASISECSIELVCATRRFALDLSRIEQSEIEDIKAFLKKLNYDSCFRLTIAGVDVDETKTDPIMAICWYQPEEWEKLKQAADDADALDDTYDDWKKGANKAIREFQAKGHKVRKINVRMDAITVWCEANGKANNLAARSKYAAEMARQRKTR